MATTRSRWRIAVVVAILALAIPVAWMVSGRLRRQAEPRAPWHEVPSSRLDAACRARLDDVRLRLQALPTTSLMAVVGGDLLFTYGREDVPSIVYSVRKSLLAMLYGRYVADGTIALDATLEQLGIDDIGGLSPMEKQARVRDLLTARSGVYHAAANSGDDSEAAPPRGSQPPGRYFLYNNWDFNAAGTVFEQQTHRGIYEAFLTDLAQPLGLQDFDPSRHRRNGDTRRSSHLAYPFFLSARDMLRIGLLMREHGRWNGRQLLPADWADTITTPVTAAALMHPPHVAQRGIGYGYLWWVPEVPAGSPLEGAYMAWGSFGQYILVAPRRGMVIVHKHDVRAAEGPMPRQVSAAAFLSIAQQLAQAPCLP